MAAEASENKPPPPEPASPSRTASSVLRSPPLLLPSSSSLLPSSSLQPAELAPRSWPFAERGETERGGDTRERYEMGGFKARRRTYHTSLWSVVVKLLQD